MQVILVKDFPQLGGKGTVTNVKNGYFRNFLAPQKVARQATAADLERFAKLEVEREAKRAEMLAKAQELMSKMASGTLEIKAKATGGSSLYAQIHEHDIAILLNKKYGCALEARDVKFEAPVKKVGTHKLVASLSPAHKVDMTLVVNGEA